MNQTMTFLRQMSVFLLLIGITACTGVDSNALKEDVEKMLTELSDEIAAVKSVKTDRQGELDGLKKDLKWEYTEELEKIVSQYDNEMATLKNHAAELNEMYDSVAGIQEKLGKSAPLEFSHKLMEEMLELKHERLEELVAEIEAVEERLIELSDKAAN